MPQPTFPSRGQKSPNFWDDDLRAYIDYGDSVEIVNSDINLPDTTPDGRILYVEVRTASDVEGVSLEPGLYAFRRTATGWSYYDLPIGTPISTSGGGGGSDPVPAAPVGLDLSEADGEITATWTAPAGTPAAIGYMYRATVDGATSAWVDLGNVLTATFDALPSKTYTVQVAAYATEGGALGATASDSIATSAGFVFVTDHLNAADGTSLAGFSAGGLSWLAPMTGDNGVTASSATINDRRVGGSTSGGHVVLPQDDAEITVRYSTDNNGQIRLHGRGSGGHVFIAGDALRSETYLGGSNISTGHPFSGVLTLRLVGATASVWIDGVKKTEFATGTATGSRWGIATYNTGYIDAVRIGPATDHTTPPAALSEALSAGAVITSDAFTGADAASLVGRVTDASLGGTPRMWRVGPSTAPALAGNRAVPGAGYGGVALPVNTGNMEAKITLSSVPTVNGVRLLIRGPETNGTGYGLWITPSGLTPTKWGGSGSLPAAVSFGTPQVGDVYTAQMVGTTLTVTAKRSGGADIGVGTQVFSGITDFGTSAPYVLIINDTDGAGWAVDNLIVTQR